MSAEHSVATLPYFKSVETASNKTEESLVPFNLTGAIDTYLPYPLSDTFEDNNWHTTNDADFDYPDFDFTADYTIDKNLLFNTENNTFLSFINLNDASTTTSDKNTVEGTSQNGSIQPTEINAKPMTPTPATVANTNQTGAETTTQRSASGSSSDSPASPLRINKKTSGQVTKKQRKPRREAKAPTKTKGERKCRLVQKCSVSQTVMLNHITKLQREAAVDISNELKLEKKLTASMLSKQFTAHTNGLFKPNCAPRWFGEKINKVNKWEELVQSWYNDGQICEHSHKQFLAFVAAFLTMSQLQCCRKTICKSCNH